MSFDEETGSRQECAHSAEVHQSNERDATARQAITSNMKPLSFICEWYVFFIRIGLMYANASLACLLVGLFCGVSTQMFFEFFSQGDYPGKYCDSNPEDPCGNCSKDMYVFSSFITVLFMPLLFVGLAYLADVATAVLFDAMEPPILNMFRARVATLLGMTPRTHWFSFSTTTEDALGSPILQIIDFFLLSGLPLFIAIAWLWNFGQFGFVPFFGGADMGVPFLGGASTGAILWAFVLVIVLLVADIVVSFTPGKLQESDTLSVILEDVPLACPLSRLTLCSWFTGPFCCRWFCCPWLCCRWSSFCCRWLCCRVGSLGGWTSHRRRLPPQREPNKPLAMKMFLVAIVFQFALAAVICLNGTYIQNLFWWYLPSAATMQAIVLVLLTQAIQEMFPGIFKGCHWLMIGFFVLLAFGLPLFFSFNQNGLSPNPALARPVLVPPMSDQRPAPFMENFSWSNTEPSYPICSASWGVPNSSANMRLNPLDLSCFAEAVYEMTNASVEEVVAACTNGTDLASAAGEPLLQSLESYLYIGRIGVFNLKSINMTVMAIRGSTVNDDWLTDLMMYGVVTPLQALSQFFPVLPLLPLSFVQNLVKFFDYRRFWGFPQPWCRHVMTADKLRREAQAQGNDFIITGHSLGGALGQIAAASTNSTSINYSPPGMWWSAKRFNVTVESVQATSVAVVPALDAVPRVDAQAAATQNVQCRGTSATVFGCHTLARTTCELYRTCGDPRGRMLGPPVGNLDPRMCFGPP